MGAETDDEGESSQKFDTLMSYKNKVIHMKYDYGSGIKKYDFVVDEKSDTGKHKSRLLVRRTDKINQSPVYMTDVYEGHHIWGAQGEAQDGYTYAEYT